MNKLLRFTIPWICAGCGQHKPSGSRGVRITTHQGGSMRVERYCLKCCNKQGTNHV